MAFSCWVGMLTFDFCCKGPWGEGLASCWDGAFTWELCCKPELEAMKAKADNFSDFYYHPDMHLDVNARREERWNSKIEQDLEVEAINSIIAPPGSPEWVRKMARCLSDYDNAASRRWFLAHSGVPAHMVSHVGNPAACVDGGHHFFWGLLVVNLKLGGTYDALKSDVALEFSICVPNTCEYAVVDAVLVPFYLGPYLGKPWGPKPEFLYRFQTLTDESSWEPSLEASSTTWMASIIAKGGRHHHEFYQREWPYRRELWQYQRTWLPSRENILVMVFLAGVPLIAGVCVVLSDLCAHEPEDEPAPVNEPVPVVAAAHRHDPCAQAAIAARAVRAVVQSFAPQTYLKELTAPIERDLTGVHVLRLLLQFLVCWQHTVLFVDWLGNGGHNGIIQFLPLTNDVARTLGRVNTTFACLTAHFSLQSVTRVLARRKSPPGSPPSSEKFTNGWQSGATVKDSSAQSTPNGASKSKRRASPAASPPPPPVPPQEPEGIKLADHCSQSPAWRAVHAGAMLVFWCMRRWLRQAGELALWTFYYLQVTEDIPWKPFPDFVQVWYRDRTQSCRRWVAGAGGLHKPQLPMWLLSLLFVYEPVNSVLRLHRPAVSLCHNMQVFENLFAISVCAAALGAVRHCWGRRALCSVAVAVAAAALRWDPPWNGQGDSDSRSSSEDIASAFEKKDRYEEVIYSTLNLLPAALTTAVLMAEVFTGKSDEAGAKPKEKRRQRRKHIWVALGLIFGGIAVDFFALGHMHLLADWWPFPASKQAVARSLLALVSYIDLFWTPVWLLREGAHAVGIAVLLRSFELGIGAGELPGWARVVSRLSLSINLTNIFAIHYLRGRLLDHPVEFSHVHVLLYTVFAWGAAVVLSLVAYCMVTPYVTAAEAALDWVFRRFLRS